VILCIKMLLHIEWGLEIPLVKVFLGPEVWGVKYHLLILGVLESERRFFPISPDFGSSSIPEFGVLRGIKSLAHAKS
jgi:hypothetical protein